MKFCISVIAKWAPMVLSMLGTFSGFDFGLGSEGSAIMTTTCVSFCALVAFSFCLSSFRLKGALKKVLLLFLIFSAGFVGSLIRIQVVHLVGGQALTLLGPIIGWYAVGWQALSSTGPNGAESWEESTFEFDVLEESFSPTAEEAQTEEGEPSVNFQGPGTPQSQTEEGEPSVNQGGPEEAGPALPAHPVEGDEAGPSHRVGPYQDQGLPTDRNGDR
ncbi:hypothetical protein EUTSA_v10022998mg [Eutrema salsugineum]|uniref:Uncharacterized protein n=1 Tax=Eutrema salsugineum TaxID=72664 RepID=V4M7H9_EUTSA|nr:hypothetical protein EUTSA_v10022998mg [Eutrema salsugineum]